MYETSQQKNKTRIAVTAQNVLSIFLCQYPDDDHFGVET